MSEYTKGKWEVLKGATFNALQVVCDGVAIVELWRRGNTPEEEANAHLISESPTMAELLEKINGLYSMGLLTISEGCDRDGARAVMGEVSATLARINNA